MQSNDLPPPWAVCLERRPGDAAGQLDSMVDTCLPVCCTALLQNEDLLKRHGLLDRSNEGPWLSAE